MGIWGKEKEVREIMLEMGEETKIVLSFHCTIKLKINEIKSKSQCFIGA